MTPLPAPVALDAYYLEARCKLLDLAAILDRIGRGGDLTDLRLDRLRRGIAALLERPAARAEALQQIFSLEYDPAWPRPTPR